MQHTLERHKAFSYVAWTVILGFAAFVYLLSQHVSTEITQLEARTSSIEASL